LLTVLIEVAEVINLLAFITLMAIKITLDELTVVIFVTATSCTSIITSCIAVKSFLIIFKYFVRDLKLNPLD